MRNAAAPVATHTGGTRALMRTTIFAAGVVLLAWSLAQRGAGATEIDPGAVGTMQVHACVGLGGEAIVNEDRDMEDGQMVVTVRCKGGLSDGTVCVNTKWGQADCTRREARPDEGSQVTPTGGIVGAGTEGSSDPALQVEGQVVGTIEEQP